MTEIIQPIPARIKNVAVGGHVAGAEDIIDDNLGKTQQTINQEVDNKIEALTSQDIEVVSALPAVGDADPKKIYRVSGTTSYTDYMLNPDGSAFSQLATFSFPGIDDEPVGGSNNLVKSSGVFNNISQLDNRITNEINRATSTENQLGNRITSEVNRALAEEARIEGRLDTNRFGYNVTVFGLVAGVHTLATAVQNVPSTERFGGQKITFKTDLGWVTYQNTSLDTSDYENVANWILDSGVTELGDVTITNNPDYEDLTQNEGGQLKFADKEYNVASYSGLGRKYFRKNIVNGVNTLTQAMLPDANTIYIIQYDYDLNGATITIPANCVLKFEGGSFCNGTITGQSTAIDAIRNSFMSITFDGTYANSVVYSDWVNNDDDTSSLQAALNLCKGDADTTLFVHSGNYTIDCINSINVDGETHDCAGLIVPSHTCINLGGATLSAATTDSDSYYLIFIEGNDVVLKDGFLIGNVRTHTGTSGENGHGIVIYGAKDIVIDNIHNSYFWGDGIFIRTKVLNPEAGADANLVIPENILVTNCICDHNRRQGMSVISVDGLRVYNSRFINTGTPQGTPPKAGIDFEQNWYNDEIINDVIVESCDFIGNSKGIVINDKLSMSATRTDNILISNCNVDGTCQIRMKNTTSVVVRNTTFSGWIQYANGNIEFDNCMFRGHWHLQSVDDQIETVSTVRINGCSFNLQTFYGNRNIFDLQGAVGTKNIVVTSSSFNIVEPLPSTYNLLTDNSGYQDLVSLNLDSCTICSSIDETQSFPYYKVKVAASYICSCIINRCAQIKLFRADGTKRMVCRGNKIFFGKHSGDTTPYFAFDGYISRGTATRDIVIADNVFNFDNTSYSLWEDPSLSWSGSGTYTKMLCACNRNYSSGLIFEDYTRPEWDYFTLYTDEQSPATSNYIVRSSINYNSSGNAKYQSAMSADKGKLLFFNGTYWVDALGFKCALKKGNTSSRPSFLDANDAGYLYFDTSLSKLVVWNGSAWTNLDGTALT